MKRKAMEVYGLTAILFTALMIISTFAGFVTPAMATAEPPVVDRVDAFASSSNDFKEQVLALQDLNPKIDPLIEQEMKIRPDEKIPIIIVLKDQHLKDIPERFDVKEAKSLARSSQKSLASSIKQMQAVEMRQHWIINAISVKVPAEEIDEIAARQDVEKVWLDAEIKLIEPVVTPLTDQADYGDENINAHLLWDMGFNGTGINISILDTGIDTTHPDLDEGKVIFEKDFTGEGTTDDLCGHGTHVAGIAAGEFNATSGVRGVAYGASLFNARVLGADGGQVSWIIAGIEWSVNNHADVICMSLGSWQGAGDGSDPLSMVVTNAVDEHGVVVVVAAGNEGPGEGTIGNPAVAYGAIAVAASDSNDNIADFSSRGPTGDGRVGVDLAAPGVAILAPCIIGDYISKQGTSMAAPHVAGATALLLEANPLLTPVWIEIALKNSADDIGSDILEQGAGRLDVMGAYDALMDGILVYHESDFGMVHPGLHRTYVYGVWNNNITADVSLAINHSIMADTQGDGGGDWMTTPNSLFIPAGETGIFTVTMNVPHTAVGMYVGEIILVNTIDVPITDITIPVSVNVVWDGVVEEYITITGEVDECGSRVFPYGDWVYYTLEIPYAVAITTHLTISLDWIDSANDLNLHLFDPDGVEFDSTGVDKPEVITVNDPVAGRWIVAIHARYLSIAPETYDLTVVLEEGGIISGRVTCYQGNPVADAWVYVWDPVTWADGWAETDAEGNYTITGLAAGTYEMEVIPPEGVYLAPAFIYDIEVIAGETTTVDVILKEGGIISGRVTCYLGHPVIDAWVYVWDPETDAHDWVETDAEGYYTTTGLATGTYKMIVIPPEGVYLAPTFIYDIVVTAGETTTVDAILLLEEGGIISGRVTCHEGYLVADAEVFVWDQVTGACGWAWTDDQGNYTTTGLAAGTYEMVVIPPEGVYLAPAFIYDIVVTAGETTIVNVILEPPAPMPIFDTGSGTYPSISGMHNGTITPNQTITATKLYTYPLPGTGGHTKSVHIWNETGKLIAIAEWDGFVGDWRNISFDEPVVLLEGKTYNFTIITGSYPQIHHTEALLTADGWINCTGFMDVNGNIHQGWIPAIKLWA